MPAFELAKRVANLPPYLFAEIDRVKNEIKAKGVDIIDLGVGDPDLPTPQFIIDELDRAARNPENHRYPSYSGMNAFRYSVAAWYQTRFGVSLDPMSEVLTLIGSKEGIAHFPFAFVNPGDLVLVCSPNYPVYNITTMFAGGEVRFVPLLEENDFLPDLESISPDEWRRAKIIYVNYPNNPTAAVADAAFYRRLIDKAAEYDVIVVHDAAYTEMYYDQAKKPMSILEMDGGKDVAIEFHSLSKTYSMTGWRIGMAVGHPLLVKGLGKIKENVDSGAFQAVQYAGMAALERGEPYAQEYRDIYRERRDVVVAGLTQAGISCRNPEATFYVWCKVPKGFTSTTFVSTLLQKTGVVVTPGNGFGSPEPGEGYFRISLTLGKERLEEAVARIRTL